eukprot:gene572-462_t
MTQNRLAAGKYGLSSPGKSGRLVSPGKSGRGFGNQKSVFGHQKSGYGNQKSGFGMSSTKGGFGKTSTHMQKTGGRTGRGEAHTGAWVCLTKGSEKVDATPQPLMRHAAVDSSVADHREERDVGVTLGKGTSESVDVRQETAHSSRAPSKEDLESIIDIVLKENETKILLDIPSVCVAMDNVALHTAVSERNEAYDQLLVTKVDSDNYISKSAQTISRGVSETNKSKAVQADKPKSSNKEVNVSRHVISDAFATPEKPIEQQLLEQCTRESQTIVSSVNLLDVNDIGTATAPESSSKKESSLHSKQYIVGHSTKLSSSHTSGLHAPQATKESEAEAEAAQMDEEEDATTWQVCSEDPVPDELGNALRIMERIVSQNVFHGAHMTYRNYPTLEQLANMGGDVDDSAVESAILTDMPTTIVDVDGGGDLTIEKHRENDDEEEVEAEDQQNNNRNDASLKDLFTFERSTLTKNLPVTCAEWNAENKDLLAVSYGNANSVTSSEGLVLFWSLKNPKYPERVLKTNTGVTSLSFSKVTPNLVSAGMHDGTVAIWDLRKDSDTPVLESEAVSQTERKHTAHVWDKQWVDRGPEKVPREVLATVGAGGRVLMWSMKKGLEQSVLMQLKRLQNPYLGSNSVLGHPEGIVFSKALGFSIDFPQHDPSTYLVGTEDGLVHRCSTSYNEQYLDTYYGHTAAVYKVRCNPFWSHSFLTCSEDWTMRLWSTKPLNGNANTDGPLLTFQSMNLNESVNDICWSPDNSTFFASCMGDGRVELWDLTENLLDPIVAFYPDNNRTRRTCVRFALNSPVLVCGDSEGKVNVMRMLNTEIPRLSEEEQQQRLLKVINDKSNSVHSTTEFCVELWLIKQVFHQFDSEYNSLIVMSFKSR